MVKLHSSEMFLKDPVDAWGEEKTIGLAEHSVRRFAPPITPLLKSGSLLYWDGYESGVPKYELYQVLGGTVNRSIDYTSSGSFSLKCTPTGGAGSQAGATYYLTDFHEDTISVKATITSPNHTGWHFCISILYYDGTSVNTAGIRYSADGTMAYNSSGGAWTPLTSISRYGNEYNWGSMNLAVDLDKNKYSSARIYRDDIDMSDYSLHTAANPANKHIQVQLYFEDIAGTSIVGYLDDVIMMENV